MRRSCCSRFRSFVSHIRGSRSLSGSGFSPRLAQRLRYFEPDLVLEVVLVQQRRLDHIEVALGGAFGVARLAREFRNLASSSRPGADSASSTCSQAALGALECDRAPRPTRAAGVGTPRRRRSRGRSGPEGPRPAGRRRLRRRSPRARSSRRCAARPRATALARRAFSRRPRAAPGRRDNPLRA